MLNKKLGSRSRRFFVARIGSSEVHYLPSANRDSKIVFSVGDAAAQKPADTAVQTAFKTAGKIIASGGDLITAPAVWLKDIQKNWLIYLVVAAVILVSMVILYCAIHSYFVRKGKHTWSTMDLVNLVTTFNSKTGTPPGQLPFVCASLPSTGQNSIEDIKVKT